MGLNFPSSPAVGTLYPDPVIAGVPQYRWNGQAWLAGADSKVSFVVSDTPPAAPIDGMLWWESDRGILYIRYNDGVGASQWVEAVAVPVVDISAPSGKFYAREGATWVEVPRYQRLSLAGFSNFDVQVPAGAVGVRVSGVLRYLNNNATPLYCFLSLSAGVFMNTAGNYSLYGFYQKTSDGPPGIADFDNNQTHVGMLMIGLQQTGTWPAFVEGYIALKRPDTAQRFAGNFRGATTTNVDALQSSYMNVLIASPNSALSVLALRFGTTTVDVWAGDSYLNLEWV